MDISIGTRYRSGGAGAWSAFRADIARTYRIGEGGPLRRTLECLGTPGLHALAAIRFGQWSLACPGWARIVLDPIYLLLNLAVRVLWGIDMSRRTRIGPGLYIAHFGGIVISPRAVIGARCNISQGVTIGVSGRGDRSGVPVIGNDVYIAPGACLFGPIRIGNNVKIGANAVIGEDLPDNAIAVLDPGFRIVSYRGNRDAARAAEGQKTT